MDYALQNARIDLGTLGTFGSSLTSGLYIKFDYNSTSATQSTIFGSATNDNTILRITAHPTSGGDTQMDVRMGASGADIRGRIDNAAIYNGANHTFEFIITLGSDFASDTIVMKMDGVALTVTKSGSHPTGMADFATRLLIGGQDNGFGSIVLTHNATIDNFKLGFASDNLVAHYLFNEGTGGAATVLADETVNENDATLLNAATWVDGLTASLATLTASAATQIYSTSAEFSGILTDDGGGTIAEKGFVWGTSTNPTIDTNKRVQTGSDTMSDIFADLLPNTTYYYRAYAISGAGASYSANQSFQTLESPGFFDLFGINIGQEFQSGFNSSFPGYIDVTTPSTETIKQLRSDVEYLKRLGFKNFRFAMPDYSWVARLDFYETLLTEIAKIGNLHLVYGIGPQNNPQGWSNFYNIIDVRIKWFQTLINTYASNGVTGEWYVANELDHDANISTSNVTGISRASNVVTVNCGFDHHLEIGDRVVIAGSSVLAGTFTITSVPTTSTYTVSHSGTDTTTSGGNYKHTITTTRNLIRRLATHFKTLTSPNITVMLTYSVIQNWEVFPNYYHIHYWTPEFEGKGDLDRVCLNAYGISDSSPAVNLNHWKNQVNVLYQAYGNNSSITEWNNYEDDTETRVLNNDVRLRKIYLMDRRVYMHNRNIPHYFFAYRMPAILAEKLPAYNNIGAGIRSSFYQLAGKRSPFVEMKAQ